MIRAVYAWGPAVLWAAVLFFLSTVPDPPGSRFATIPGADKLGHLVLYAILGASLARARGLQGGPPHSALILAGALYGASDEWHQSFVPGRQVSAIDWVADLCGVAAGYWIALSLQRRRTRSTTSASRNP